MQSSAEILAEIEQFTSGVAVDELEFESDEDAYSILRILVDLYSELADVSGEEPTGLAVANELLTEVCDDIARTNDAGSAWVESVTVNVNREALRSDLQAVIKAAEGQCAGAFYSDPNSWERGPFRGLTYRGLVSYCRHRLTNYECLLEEAAQFDTDLAHLGHTFSETKSLLKKKVTEAVKEALAEVGVEEFSVGRELE